MEESQIKQIIEQQPLHGSALLDPRCKILLLVCIGFVSYFLAGEVVSLALMLVYGLFIAVGNGGKWALKMIVVYIIVAYLNALLRYVQVPVLSVIMSVFGVTLLKLIPIVMMGLWILRTTYMDDLMVALQRMRLPQAVTIPLVVMFRYIPTLRIEYRQIRSTMDIRGISDTLWKRVSHPLATIEYILIPLLMRCLKVTDELAASGTTRGLELECKRYALRPIRFSWPEILVSLLGIAVLGRVGAQVKFPFFTLGAFSQPFATQRADAIYVVLFTLIGTITIAVQLYLAGACIARLFPKFPYPFYAGGAGTLLVAWGMHSLGLLHSGLFGVWILLLCGILPVGQQLWEQLRKRRTA